MRNIKITFSRDDAGMFAKANDVMLFLIENKEQKLADKFYEKLEIAERLMDEDKEAFDCTWSNEDK